MCIYFVIVLKFGKIGFSLSSKYQFPIDGVATMNIQISFNIFLDDKVTLYQRCK